MKYTKIYTVSQFITHLFNETQMYCEKDDKYKPVSVEAIIDMKLGEILTLVGGEALFIESI